MNKDLLPFICYGVVLALSGCTSNANNKDIVYTAVNNNIYKPDSNYEKSLLQWGKIYKDCIGYQLFSDAFYTGLQQTIYPGSICNKSAINVNGNISIFDTTFSKNMFDLFAVITSANCAVHIDSAMGLQKECYAELKKVLGQTASYRYLKDIIDTTQMTFQISTLVDNSIRADSLISVLQITTDTTLLHFKKLLLTPGNALLVHTAMIIGFSGEFPLIKKLSAADEQQFNNEVSFHFGDRNETGSIKLLSNHYLKITLNTHYIVAGQFYFFHEAE